MTTSYEPEYRKLLIALKEARKAAGMSQQEVADELGEHQSFVSKYENGERRLDAIELAKIATVLGTNYDKLLKKALL